MKKMIVSIRLSLLFLLSFIFHNSASFFAQNNTFQKEFGNPDISSGESVSVSPDGRFVYMVVNRALVKLDNQGKVLYSKVLETNTGSLYNTDGQVFATKDGGVVFLTGKADITAPLGDDLYLSKFDSTGTLLGSSRLVLFTSNNTIGKFFSGYEYNINFSEDDEGNVWLVIGTLPLGIALFRFDKKGAFYSVHDVFLDNINIPTKRIVLPQIHWKNDTKEMILTYPFKEKYAIVCAIDKLLKVKWEFALENITIPEQCFSSTLMGDYLFFSVATPSLTSSVSPPNIAFFAVEAKQNGKIRWQKSFSLDKAPTNVNVAKAGSKSVFCFSATLLNKGAIAPIGSMDKDGNLEWLQTFEACAGFHTRRLAGTENHIYANSSGGSTALFPKQKRLLLKMDSKGKIANCKDYPIDFKLATSNVKLSSQKFASSFNAGFFSTNKILKFGEINIESVDYCDATKPDSIQIIAPDSACIGATIQLDFKPVKNSTNPSWTFTGGLIDTSLQKKPSIFINKNATYNIELQVISNGCPTNVLKKINIKGEKIETRQILTCEKEFPKVLDATIGKAKMYNWENSFGKNLGKTASILIDEKGVYKAIISDSSSCITQKIFTIEGKNEEDCSGAKLYISTVFSPNEDGINDFFEIVGKNFNLLSLQIYDRWGNQIFQSDTNNERWDGRYKNQEAQQGIYVFSLSYEDIYSKKIISKSGSVLLLRN